MPASAGWSLLLLCWCDSTVPLCTHLWMNATVVVLINNLLIGYLCAGALMHPGGTDALSRSAAWSLSKSSLRQAEICFGWTWLNKVPSG